MSKNQMLEELKDIYEQLYINKERLDKLGSSNEKNEFENTDFSTALHKLANVLKELNLILERIQKLR